MTALDELRDLIKRHSTKALTPTAVPGLVVMRRDRVSTCEVQGVYVPMVCVVAQGAKQVIVGSSTLRYDSSNYLISSVDLPVSGRITKASPQSPYLALGLELDLHTVASVLATLPPRQAEPSTPRAIAVHPQTRELLEVFARLLRLLDHPEDIAPLAPLIVREIFYRLLTAEHGAMLRQIVLEESRSAQILRVIQWIRQNYALPLQIDKLARLANMSAASLHRHFKAVTAMSPLQYQKRVRLQEARNLLISSTRDAASAGFDVGYGSPSQFSREYHRLFGAPPHQDRERLRSLSVDAPGSYA